MNEKIYKWLLDLIDNDKLSKFYTSKTIWRPKRAEILKRDNYECQECKKLGKYSAATTVHHIKHLKQYPLLALTDSNLESVCDECHNILHPEKHKNYIPKEPINKERW